MARVVITAEVEDSAQWEAAFRTHGKLLASMSQSVSYFSNDNNEVCIYSEPDDLDTYLQVLQSQDTADAMATDGVKRDTVKVYVLDRDFSY